MSCHLCGKPLGIAAAAAGDSDFCCTDHRKRFQTRLTKALVLLGRDLCTQPEPAEPIIRFIVAEELPEPVRQAEIVYHLRMPALCLTIDADPPASAAPEVETEPVSPRAEVIPQDRITVLGSRLRTLRRQLDRAARGPHRLATA